MDDGDRGGNTKKEVIINVNGYDLKSRKLLQCVMQRKDGRQWTKNSPLYVPVKS